MGATGDDGNDWEDGTALAPLDYVDEIAKSQDDEFGFEEGTAVAGQDYVENIRQSRPMTAQPDTAAPVAAMPKPKSAPTRARTELGTSSQTRTPAAGTPIAAS